MSQDIEKLLNAPPDAFEARMYFAERVLDQLESGNKLAAQFASIFAVAFVKQLNPAEDIQDFEACAALRSLQLLPHPTDDLVRMLSEQLHDMHRLHRETTRSELKCPTA